MENRKMGTPFNLWEQFKANVFKYWLVFERESLSISFEFLNSKEAR